MHRYGDEVAAIARPLRDPGDLDILLDRADHARVVLIGEASHGTHEFYQWRSALTRRLIEERGFDLLAVEGDWPDCARVDAAVRGGPQPREALLGYDRWPTWMWANEETVDFADWLRGHNASCGKERGFHGLDVYSLWESIREILVWLREHDPDQVPAALAAYHCLAAYGEDPNAYAYATRFGDASCADQVEGLTLRFGELTAFARKEQIPYPYAPVHSRGTRCRQVQLALRAPATGGPDPRPQFLSRQATAHPGCQVFC
ncbi:erythromycin esterase-like protein [Actinoplanes tereljensis]|uniref:Erythromycin esterase n=1 Tax=Paractinoplanes tereljensis TaxID=571912 RepID=A0A919NNZ0_9ACTN|nr:erythromycin esterase family protein [Actinoplanes tereljensis]GIF22389.1 hypothetical protein Ate02nite_51190 [Actinoplanes tereljensis]